MNEAHVIVSDASSRRFETSQQTFDKIDGSKNPRAFPHEPSDDQNIKITIDQGEKFQKLIGFGGAFTDAAGINIASLPQDLQTTLLRSVGFASQRVHTNHEYYVVQFQMFLPLSDLIMLTMDFPIISVD